MLYGTLLVGVPIIIYLINRQRFRRRKWAAMEFLLRAMQKNRRRIRLENLLLLLIRCAIIILLAMAMARPFIRNNVLSSISDKHQNWIFALDTSYSMGLKDGTRSLFETAKESMTNIIQSLVNNGDHIVVVTMDADPRVIIEMESMTKAKREEIRQAINNLKPGYEGIHLAASLRTILNASRKFESIRNTEIALSEKKLILFSDFQRKDWFEEITPKDPAVNNLLRQLKEANIRMSLADLKGSDRNLTVTDFNMTPMIASQDVWVEFYAEVRNFGKNDFDAVEITFYVDDVEERTNVVRVPAGSSVTARLPYRFLTAGYHSVRAELRGDGLATDNRRYLAINVRESAEVLLIDGEPGDSLLERETLLLELAMLPSDSDDVRKAPYTPVIRTVGQVLSETPDLRQYIAILFANVSAADFPGSFIEDLRHYVRDGGVFMAFLGKNVEPREYNEVFGKNEEDLLPIKILDQVNRDSAPVHLQFVEREHPIARYFLERKEFTNIEQSIIEFRRYFSFEDPGEDSSIARVLKFTDPEENLAVFDHPFGLGHVMWFASTADLDWNDFAKYWDYIPFIHEYIPYLVSFGENSINLSLGDPFRQVFEAYDFSPKVLIIPPQSEFGEDAGVPTSIPKQMAKLEDENRFELVHDETSYPGIYEIRLQDIETRLQDKSDSQGDVQGRRLLFSVNIDAAEGDLRSISFDNFEESFPDFQAEVFDASEKIKEMSMNKSAAAGTELWRFVLWMVLAFLLAESLLGIFFGRKLR